MRIALWMWGDGWGFRRFLSCWLMIAIPFLIYAKLGGLDGDYAPPKPAFSRSECIQRHQAYYYDRNPDMAELDDTKIGIIARRCAVEESEYYGW